MSISDLAAPQATPTPLTARNAPYDIAVFDSMAGAEANWRLLETAGIATPYQRFDWISAVLANGAEPDGHIAIAIISQGSQPRAILPLMLVNRFGTVRAHLIGTHQSNTDWLLSAADFTPTPTELNELFIRIGAEVDGIDLLAFFNLPENWSGKANPLLGLAHAPAASNLYAATIGPTPVPYIEHRLSNKRRNNIKRGLRRLEEMHGPVRAIRVSDAAMLERVHRVFLEQRGARFAEMGIDNVFAQQPYLGLFRDLVVQGFGADRPTMSLHALFAGDEILATCWGLTANNHYSQYINSTASGPAARYSLMGILVGEVMDELTQAGITTFDMGLGDFDYKLEWTEQQPVFNSLIALSGKGQIAAALIAGRASIKRTIKQTPALWRSAQWLRRQAFKLRARR